MVAGHTILGHSIRVHSPLYAGLWLVSYFIIAGLIMMHVTRYCTQYVIPQIPGYHVFHPLGSI